MDDDENIDVSDNNTLLLIIASIATFVYVSQLRLKILRRTSRRWWVRPLNRQRALKGFHMNLFRELKNTDNEEFFAYTGMWPHQFEELHERMKVFLPKGGIRRPLNSELKLAVTLAILAHGDSVRSKAWEFRIGRSTTYKVVREVCQALWAALHAEYLPNPSQEMWSRVAEGFFAKWQFPNCIGALDGKHIRIRAPLKSGSKYYNYKHYFSTVLMAICYADYKFIWADIGQYGSVSDGGVWGNTDFASCLESGELNLPPPRELPHTNIRTHCAFVADEAFPLGMNMLRPYSRKDLDDNHRIFNYRLSRARRTIENTFGILAARWQILLRGMAFKPDTVDDIVKALVCLHNFIMHDEDHVRPQGRRYCAPGLIDSENADHIVMDGVWRGAVDRSSVFENLRKMGRNSGSVSAKAQRDVLSEYFVSPAGEEQAPWQHDAVFRGREINEPCM